MDSNAPLTHMVMQALGDGSTGVLCTKVQSHKELPLTIEQEQCKCKRTTKMTHFGQNYNSDDALDHNFTNQRFLDITPET